MPLEIAFIQGRDHLRVRWGCVDYIAETDSIDGTGLMYVYSGGSCVGFNVDRFVEDSWQDRLHEIEERDYPYEGGLAWIEDALKRAHNLFGAYPTTLEVRIE